MNQFAGLSQAQGELQTVRRHDPSLIGPPAYQDLVQTASVCSAKIDGKVQNINVALHFGRGTLHSCAKISEICKPECIAIKANEVEGLARESGNPFSSEDYVLVSFR